jgi:serine/threonine protein kinase
MISGRADKGMLIQLPISIDGDFIHSLIAAGTTAVVFRGIDQNTGEIVALMAMSKDDLLSHKDLQRVKPELQIASRLSHPNIVKAFRVIRTEDLAILVIEQCPFPAPDWVLNDILDSVELILDVSGRL